MPRNYVVPHTGITLYGIKELGRGQFGVARAVRNNKQQVYCLKEISMRGRGDTSRQQAQKEVNLMTKVKEHPNIIRIYDHWFSSSGMFILMEFAPNGALDGVISSHRNLGKRFTEFQVLHYLQQLSSAIAFLHEERMLHRDLKPENVLIGQLGELKIADFGLSKALSPESDLCTTFAGSPLYMSPEVCMGEEYSFSTDIWSLGCIVYEVMALYSPWDTLERFTTIPALMKQITSCPPRFDVFDGIYSSKLVKTVKWMLRKTSTTRPTAYAILELCEIREPPIHDHQLRDTVDLSRLPVQSDPVSVESEDTDKDDSLCTLRRREEIVRQAAKLAEDHTRAALKIQNSARNSIIRRNAKAKEEGVKERVAQEKIQLRKIDFKVAPVLETPSVEVIQRAMRVSLNRRRLDKVIGPRPRVKQPPPPAPPSNKAYHNPARPVLYRPPIPAPNDASARGNGGNVQCSARLERLATPRYLPPPNAMRGMQVKKPPPVPRSAWQ